MPSKNKGKQWKERGTKTTDSQGKTAYIGGQNSQ